MILHKIRPAMIASGKSPISYSTLTFLDVIVGQSSAIFQLFSGENQTLLVWRNSLLVLDLGLDILDGIGRLYLKGNSLSRQSFDENLHGEFFTLTSRNENKFQKGRGNALQLTLSIIKLKFHKNVRKTPQSCNFFYSNCFW